MNRYMTNNSVRPAQALRAALKAAGFNARRVSVREDHSTLRVTIRDASASLSKVADIAEPFEKVHRCEASGEILCGGNVYVQVAYAKEVVEPVRAAILAVLEPAPLGEWVAVLGRFRALRASHNGAAVYNEEVRLDGAGFEIRNSIAFGLSWAALRLAIAYLDASAHGEGSAA